MVKNVAIGVLAVFLLGAGVFGGVQWRERSRLQVIFDEAGGGVLELVENQRNAIEELRNDLGAAIDAADAANADAGELRGTFERVAELNERSIGIVGELGRTVATSGGTIQDIIANQLRDIELAERLAENYRLIAAELRGGAR